MSLPVFHSLREYHLNVYVSSIGATPTVGYAAVTKKGRIVGIKAVQAAAVTGTTAVAVAVNGGTALSSAALSITGGTAGTAFTATLNSTDAADVTEDDVISITPSSGTGAGIAGHFTLVIRT